MVMPQYWVLAEGAIARTSRRIFACESSFLGFRRVARNNDNRSCIAALLPWSPASYGWIIAAGPNAHDLAMLCSIFNSFVFDYLLRSSFSQASIPQATFEQTPGLKPSLYGVRGQWGTSEILAIWVQRRVLELTHTAWDMALRPRP